MELSGALLAGWEKALERKDALRQMQRITRKAVRFTIDLQTDCGLLINGFLFVSSESRSAKSRIEADRLSICEGLGIMGIR